MYAIQTSDDGHVIAFDKEHPVVFDPERDFLFAELPEGITEENIFEYAYRDGAWVHDIRPADDEPEDPATEMQAQIEALKSQNEMLLECVLEMSEILYA